MVDYGLPLAAIVQHLRIARRQLVAAHQRQAVWVAAGLRVDIRRYWLSFSNPRRLWMLTAVKQAVLLATRLIIETAQAAGAEGIPSGSIYAVAP